MSPNFSRSFVSFSMLLLLLCLPVHGQENPAQSPRGAAASMSGTLPSTTVSGEKNLSTVSDPDQFKGSSSLAPEASTLPSNSTVLPEESRVKNAGGTLNGKKGKKPSWWESLFIILYADAIMSVENVLIIAILVSNIPARIRMVAVFIGLMAAGVFRIGFAAAATVLMKYPVVALLGSITLFFLAVSLFTDTIRQIRKQESHHHEPPEEKIEWATVKEELHRMFFQEGFWKSSEGEALKTVMTSVILQDILLSLDNVLVVAGNSHGDLGLTFVGVLLSVIMMGTIANMMVTLVKKYPILGLIGGLALSKAAYNLYFESYSPEAAVVAFGSIVVFMMFARVYKKLTTDEEEEVKPLSIYLGEEAAGELPKAVSMIEAEKAEIFAEEAAPAGTPVSDELTRELIAYLKRNMETLARLETMLAEQKQE